MSARRQLGLLIGLRWTLAMRGITRLGWFGRVITLVFTVSFAFLIYQAVAAQILHSSSPLVAVRVILAVVMALGILLPLISFHQGSVYDPSVLFRYPIRPVTVFWGSVLSRLLSLSSLFPLAIGLALATSLGDGLVALPLRLGIFVLFHVTLLAASQTILLRLHSLLSRRRVRDALTLVSTFFAIAVYIAVRHALTGEPGADLAEVAKKLPPAAWGLLPSTWAADPLAHGLELDAQDAWGCLALVVSLAFFSGAGARASRHAFFAEIQTQSSGDGGIEKDPATRILGWLPRAVRTVTQRELKHFWRDPILKGLVIRQMGFVAIPIVYQFLQLDDRRGHLSGVGLVHLATVLLVLSESAVLLNLLTLEGKGLQHTFLLPLKGRDLLLGKNIAYGIWFLPLNVGVLLGVHWLFEVGMSPAALVIQGVGCFLVACAVGNLVSVYLPFATVVGGRRAIQTQASESQGAGRVFARFGMVIAIALLCAPILLILTFADTRAASWPRLGYLVGSSAYPVLMYWGVLASAGRALERRQELILAVIR